jgi:predicted nuclease with TOPRIM domain
MKFVNTKKPREYAQRLAAVKAEMAELQERMKALKEEESELEQFLHGAAGENFQFNGADGYLMTMKFNERSRRVMDQPKVRAMFEKMGLKIPTRKSEWVETSIDYAEE